MLPNGRLDSVSDSAEGSDLDILGEDPAEGATAAVPDSNPMPARPLSDEAQGTNQTVHLSVLSGLPHQGSLEVGPGAQHSQAHSSSNIQEAAMLLEDDQEAAGAALRPTLSSSEAKLKAMSEEDHQGAEAADWETRSHAHAAQASYADGSTSLMIVGPEPADQRMQANGYVSDDEDMPLAASTQLSLPNRSISLETTPSKSPTPELDDEDDDEVPIGKLAAGKAAKASTAGSKRTRRNLMPRISRGQRCGKCRTCLNPQMKKACETVRAQHMNKMGESGDLPLSMLGKLQEGPSSSSVSELPRAHRPAASRSYAALEQDMPVKQPLAKRHKSAAAAEQEQPEDAFSKALTEILSGTNGKIGERHAARLQKLCKDEIVLEKRHVLLDVLQEHCLPPTKVLFVHGSGLQTLETWFTEAMQHSKLQLAEKVLKVLKIMPVDIPALQTCTLGKTLSRLRKSAPEHLQSDMFQLVAGWKRLLEPDTSTTSTKPSAPAAVGDKRPREAAPQANGVAKTAKTVADPAAKRPAAVQKPPQDRAASSSAAAVKAMQPQSQPQPQPVKAAGGAPLRSVLDITTRNAPNPSSGTNLMAMDDDAIFKKAAAPAKAVGRSPAVPSVHKVNTLKRLDTDTAKELGKQRMRLPSDTGSPAAHAKAPAAFDQSAEAEGAKAEASASTVPRSTVGGTTRIGGASALPLSAHSSTEVLPQPWELTAKQRAQQAADRVPSPPREGPSEQSRAPRRRVGWVSDTELVRTRWFLKEDAPNRVRQEDDDLAPEPGAAHVATAEEPPSGGFQRAAQQEHMNEAAALFQHPQEEEEDDAAAGMSATMEWWAEQSTFLVDMQSEADPVGQGDESAERPSRLGHIQSAREVVGSYRHPLPDPAEPPYSWTPGTGEPALTFPWTDKESQQPAAGPAPAQPPQQQELHPTFEPPAATLFPFQSMPGLGGPVSPHLDVEFPHEGSLQSHPQASVNPQPSWQPAEESDQEEAHPFTPGPARGGRGRRIVTRGRHADHAAGATVRARGFERGRSEASWTGRGRAERGRASRASWSDRGRGSVHAGGRDAGRGAGSRGRGRDSFQDDQIRGGRKVCIFFNTAKGCRKGDECPFAHVVTDQSRDEVQAEIERISHHKPRSQQHADASDVAAAHAQPHGHARAHVHQAHAHPQPHHDHGHGKQHRKKPAGKGAHSGDHVRTRERDDAWG